MNPLFTRRLFLRAGTAGAVIWGLQRMRVEALAASADGRPRIPQTKVRVGKVYLGHPSPGWPSSRVDLAAEVERYEGALRDLNRELADVEFIDCGIVQSEEHHAQAAEKLKGADGVLAIHLTLGTGPQIERLLGTGLPLVLFAEPFSGHRWHVVASWQRQGKKIEVLPSSDLRDLAVAVRPFRALHRLREARVLHLSQNPADAAYCQALREKFGTEIISLGPDDLQKAYDQADASEAAADAERWIQGATKMVEPTREEVLKGSRVYVAMKDLIEAHRAVTITMNCLGMGLVERGMGYPCLGFARLNDAGLGGVCEADLKSTMTDLIFSFLVDRPGFVTDPAFDLSNSTILHAHCVSATQMEGPSGPAAPYLIRSHLEDGRGASLQVKLPIGGKVSMARLIGTDMLLFSTGDAVDSLLVERGCRTKLTMKVANIDKFLSDWSCGLHRVLFYGDHTRDIRRFCRFAGIRLLQEGVEDLQSVPGLEWEPHVHA